MKKALVVILFLLLLQLMTFAQIRTKTSNLHSQGAPRVDNRTKIFHYRDAPNTWRYEVGEEDSQINLFFNLSEDGIGNKPYYRVGQKYYEVEVHTPSGMTEFVGLLQKGTVVWCHNARGRTRLSDARLIKLLNKFVSLGMVSESAQSNGEPITVINPAHRQVVLGLGLYPGLRRYVRQTQ